MEVPQFETILIKITKENNVEATIFQFELKWNETV
jgi:hypothetical protein